MNKKYNWGLIGCSTIMSTFLEGLRNCEQAKVKAIGSRDIKRAKKFADDYSIPAYGSYEDILLNPDIDIIYVATTNDMHKYPTKLALENGKHVLCEKPMSINSKDAIELTALSQEKNVFLMEGMWTRFLPFYKILDGLLKHDIIGDIQYIQADFGFKGTWDEKRRLLNKDLIGGTLMDNGIYPIAFTTHLFGTEPSRISSFSKIGRTGVDELVCHIFEYENKYAQLSSSITHETPQTALIVGDKGYITIPKFWKADTLYVTYTGQTSTTTIEAPYETKSVYAPYKSVGFQHEAQEVMNCISKGSIESKVMSHAETIGIAKIMDTIRDTRKG